jgi:hypothetical protein
MRVRNSRRFLGLECVGLVVVEKQAIAPAAMSAKRLLSFTMNATSFSVFGTATLNGASVLLNARPFGTCSVYLSCAEMATSRDVAETWLHPVGATMRLLLKI